MEPNTPQRLGRVQPDAQLPLQLASRYGLGWLGNDRTDDLQLPPSLTPREQGQRKGRDGADDAVQHIPPSILAEMHTTMRGFVGRTFIADQVRAELPEAAKLWLEAKGHENAWGGWWQRCYVATGLIIRTGRHFPALRKACRGRLQPEWCFASDVTLARLP